MVEIGPGLGFLTRFLSDSQARTVAVELDRECVADLNELNLPHVEVVHGDFLQFDFDTVDSTIKIVGNVPYQITTPIIAHIFGEIGEPKSWLSKVRSVVMTVQLEVAQRFVAKPGTKDYSQITLLVNYFATARIIATVPPISFYPEPAVNSAIVHFTPLAKPGVECSTTRLLRQVIRAGFSQRRKMLKNNLSFVRTPQEALLTAFEQANIDPQARAEQLSLQQFAKLTESLAPLLPQSATSAGQLK